MAYIRQSKPDSSLGFQVRILQTSKFLPLRSETASDLAFIAAGEASSRHRAPQVVLVSLQEHRLPGARGFL